MKRPLLWILSLASASLLTVTAIGMESAPRQQQKKPVPKGIAPQSVYYSNPPSGYVRVGETDLYCKQQSTIDFYGRFGDQYYGSTYSDGGYHMAISYYTDDGMEYCSGITNNGYVDGTFLCTTSVQQQGDLARVTVSITNRTEYQQIFNFGVYADVMIGNNDSAPITRRIDTLGNTYGLTMSDGAGAQLCILFGDGLAGVTGIDDMWFGNYGSNSSDYNIVGNYDKSGNWMVENGSYDSAMGWCWRDRALNAGETTQLSYLIGVGEVNLEPNSSFTATPDDPDNWNDLSLPHSLLVEGNYDSPAGLNGYIDYAVEQDEEWHQLTDELKSGDTFSGTVIARFDPTLPTHTIRFRTRDQVGNITMLHPIEYADVSFHELTGVTDMEYNSTPLTQDPGSLTCDIAADQYALGNYRNNILAGTASFEMSGVFPYTIGKRRYEFNITPCPMSKVAASLSDGYGEMVYNGYSWFPAVEAYHYTPYDVKFLSNFHDYECKYLDNIHASSPVNHPRVVLTGKGNYCDTLAVEFEISRCTPYEHYFNIQMPDNVIIYDGKPHQPQYESYYSLELPDIEFSYTIGGEVLQSSPVEPGSYAVSAILPESYDNTMLDFGHLGTLIISRIADSELALLQTIPAITGGADWTTPWDFTTMSLPGVTIDSIGHVTGIDLSNRNLSGPVPVTLLTLPALQSLNLNDNKLVGQCSDDMLGSVNNASLKSLSINNNTLTGDIYALASRLPSLNYLSVKGNCFTEISAPLSTDLRTLEIGQQCIPLSNPLHALMMQSYSGDLHEVSASSFSSTLTTYDHWSRSYNQAPAQVYIGDLTQGYFYGRINDDGSRYWYHASVSFGDYGYSFNQWLHTGVYFASGSPMQALVYSPSGAYVGYNVTLDWIEADANIDGLVDILDLQTTVNAALSSMTEDLYSRQFNFLAADLNGDDRHNVQDIVGYVNLLIATDPVAVASRVATPYGDTTPSQAAVYFDGGSLTMESGADVAAIDLLIEGHGLTLAKLPAGMTASLTESGDNTRLIIYSASGASFGEGEFVIATLSDASATAPAILAATMADIDARRIKVATGSTSSITLNGAVGDIKATMTNGDITLTAPCDMTDVRFIAATPDGRVLAHGTIDRLDALTPVVIARAIQPSQMVIVTIADGSLSKVFKLIN